jgi:hypothetical protein
VNEQVLARDGEHREINAGQTAYVWAGGVVLAHGGRVTVGSGGLCLSDGDTVVSLVDDCNWTILPKIPAPVAVLRSGRANAEIGSAYLGEGCRYDATGSAHISNVRGMVRGEISDGRRVKLEDITNDTLDQVWSAAYQQWAGNDTPEEGQTRRSEMAAEPGPDAAAWLAPVVDRLIHHGAVRLDTQVRYGCPVLRVSTPDPFACVLAVYQDIAVPPTVTLASYYNEITPFHLCLDTTYGAHIEVVATTYIPMPRPLPGLDRY